MEANQEAKARERDEDKVTRARERKEDMEHILAVIQRGIQKELRAAMEPLEERLEQQEKVNKELFIQLNSLKEEFGVLKEAVKDQPSFPVLPQPHGQQDHQTADSGIGGQVLWNREGGRGARPLEDNHGVLGLCTSARKVIGFTPIEPRMLEIQMENYGAKDLEETKLIEVKSYLKCEMRMLPSDIEKLNITRIFPPAKPDWNVLYVEFGSEIEADTIFRYTRNMVKKDHRVINWIPKQMYERFRAVESLAYTIRKEEGLKTRVKIGQTDFKLLTRDPNSSLWTTRHLPDNLPAFDQIFQPQLHQPSYESSQDSQVIAERRTSI